MLAKSVITRWINFIEQNPNLSADNFRTARGIKYRGTEVYPWSMRTNSLFGCSKRAQQCFYWTVNGSGIVDARTTEEDCNNVLTFVQIELTKYKLKNPDETIVTGKQIGATIQAINQLGWVNL